MTPQEERNRRFDEKNEKHWGIKSVGAFDIKSFLTSEVNLTIEQVEKWASTHNYDLDIEFTENIIPLSDLLSFLNTLKK